MRASIGLRERTRESQSGTISNSVFDSKFSHEDKDKDETTNAKRAKTKEERRKISLSISGNMNRYT